MKKHLLIIMLWLLSSSAGAQISGWQYALPITVNNTGSALTDYQFGLTINTAQYVTGGQMLTTGNDIRFGSPCGTTLYDYFIESGMNSATTKIWVKIPSLAASSTTTIYMFFGNSAASAASTLSVFNGPFSSTNQVAVPTVNSLVANSQRGFRFSPNEDVLVTSFGKREPTGTTRYVTLFNVGTQAVLAQEQVAGPAGTYSYAPLTTPIWLTSGTQYTVQLFQGSSDGYYYGSSTQINPALTYYEMRYCNTCSQNTFPTNTLANYHYGVPDFQFYTKTSATTPPTYTLGTASAAGTLSIVSDAGSTACSNATITFTATTNITSPTYTWKKNGGVVGTNSATYSTNTLNTGDVITCEINDPVFCTTITSNAITMTMVPGPSATISGTTALCGGQTTTINFSGGANNTITYNINGGAPQTITLNSGGTATITTPPLTSTVSYNLVTVENTTCTVPVTGSAVVTVSPQPYAAVSVTGANPVCGGQSSAFTITGIPGGTINYNIDGGVTQSVTLTGTGSITIPSPPLMNSMTYNLIDVTSSLGCFETVTSSATVNVTPSPTANITGSAGICPGESAAITINFTGAQPYNFTYSDGTNTTPITNHTSNSYTFTVSPTVTTNYTVVALSDINCTAPTNGMTGTATVTANTPPSINGPISGATACSGNGTSFTVNASGSGLSYQWLVNGSPLSNIGVYTGVGNATLNISNVTGLGNNIYSVTVSGTCSPSVTSNTATLTDDPYNYWMGNFSTDWSTPGNWSCGTIPTVVTDVVIHIDAIQMPLVDIPTAICNSVLIENDASLGFAGTTNILEVKADIIAQGEFTADSGSVVLSGGEQSIPGVTYGELHLTGAGFKTSTSSLRVRNTLELTSGHLILGANDLTLAQNTSIVGGSSASFVVTDNTGVVTRNNMGTGGTSIGRLFPIGSSSLSYTPVTVTNTGTLDDISARVINNVYASYTGDVPTGVIQSSNAVNKTWLISEGTPGGSNATIAPQWSVVNELTTFNRGACYVSHYNTTTNAWEPGAVGAATGSNPYTHSMTNVTDFSPFGVGSQSSPLALDLLSFSGTVQGKNTVLTWETVNEFNVADYEIERSGDDGVSFKKIGRKAPSGNSKGGNNFYTYTDINAFPTGEGKFYYRLKSLETSGRVSYSKVIMLSSENPLVSIPVSIYPNPVTGETLHVTLGEKTGNALQLSVTDINGKVLFTKALDAGSYDAYNIPVNVSELVPGNYILSITDDKSSLLNTIKFTRQ